MEAYSTEERRKRYEQKKQQQIPSRYEQNDEVSYCKTSDNLQLQSMWGKGDSGVCVRCMREI